MKTFFSTVGLLLLAFATYAQETEERGQQLYKDIIEVYHVLKDSPDVKHGLYQVRYKKTTALASGLYDHNKRVGTWHFFNTKGVVTQNYDYDTNTITYETADNTIFQYTLDGAYKVGDIITKPVRIGGHYLGYLPYKALYKRPSDLSYGEGEGMYGTMELLISPGGNLADFTIHLIGYYYKNDLNVNIDLLKPEDKKFIPATVNGEGVTSRILISFRIERDKITF